MYLKYIKNSTFVLATCQGLKAKEIVRDFTNYSSLNYSDHFCVILIICLLYLCFIYLLIFDKF